MAGPGTTVTHLGYIPKEVKYDAKQALKMAGNGDSYYNGTEYRSMPRHLDAIPHEVAFRLKGAKYSDYDRYVTSLNGFEVPGKTKLKDWRKRLMSKEFGLNQKDADRLVQEMTMAHIEIVGITNQKTAYESELKNNMRIQNVAIAGLTQLIGYEQYQAFIGDELECYPPTEDEIDQTNLSKLYSQGGVWKKTTLRVRPVNHYDRITKELLLMKEYFEHTALFHKMFDVQLSGEPIHYIQYAENLNKMMYLAGAVTVGVLTKHGVIAPAEPDDDNPVSQVLSLEDGTTAEGHEITVQLAGLFGLFKPVQATPDAGAPGFKRFNGRLNQLMSDPNLAAEFERHQKEIMTEISRMTLVDAEHTPAQYILGYDAELSKSLVTYKPVPGTKQLQLDFRLDGAKAQNAQTQMYTRWIASRCQWDAHCEKTRLGKCVTGGGGNTSNSPRFMIKT